MYIGSAFSHDKKGCPGIPRISPVFSPSAVDAWQQKFDPSSASWGDEERLDGQVLPSYIKKGATGCHHRGVTVPVAPSRTCSPRTSAPPPRSPIINE
jgi:hypothetical protein